MKTSLIFGIFFLGFFLNLALMSRWLVTVDNHWGNTYKAIQQCEAELPRHLHCKAVYGAKIVDEGNLVESDDE